MTKELIEQIRTLILKAQKARPLYSLVLKYNRNQLRVPGGHGRESGRFAKGGVSRGTHGADAGTAKPIHRPWATKDPGMERSREYPENVPDAGYATMRKARGGKDPDADARSVAPLKVRGGKEFINRPRGVGLPEVPKAPHTPPKMLETPALTSGDVSTVDRQMHGGVNASYLVTMNDPDHTKAMLKTEVGERWGSGFWNDDISDLITNKRFSLAEREAIASEISVGLGYGELVPETHLRENIKAEGIEFGSEGGDDEDEMTGGYDEDYAQERYEKYKERADEQAMEAVGEEMAQNFKEAQKEHVDEIEGRVEELKKIWEEEKEDFIDPESHGSRTAMAEHPVLPMGSADPFKRREAEGNLNPLELLDEAEIDFSAELIEDEEEKLREIIRGRLEEGYEGLDDLDEDEARDHLDRDEWYEQHQDTEANLYESKAPQTFTEWRHEQGYNTETRRSGGGGHVKNPDAPHPHGGSLQRFVPDLEDDGDPNFEDSTKMAVLDYVLGTMDRHGGNMKFVDNRPVAIDNGYSMPAAFGADDFTFRSKIVKSTWMRFEEHRDVPEELRTPVLEAMNLTDWNAMADRHPNMNKRERESFLARVENMKTALATPEGLANLWHNLNLTD